MCSVLPRYVVCSGPVCVATDKIGRGGGSSAGYGEKDGERSDSGQVGEIPVDKGMSDSSYGQETGKCKQGVRGTYAKRNWRGARLDVSKDGRCVLVGDSSVLEETCVI